MDAEEILEAIREILKDADLHTITAKKVRKQLEERFGVDFTERKKEISNLTMQVVEEMGDGEDESEEEEESEPEVDIKPAVKRKSTSAATSPAKRGKKSESAVASPAKPVKKRRTKKVEGDEDGDGEKPKKKGGGYVAPLVLSPELAAIMGEPEMKRSDVVKQMWAIIKERNLKDPKDGRYHICDEQLMTVFGIKRVKTFGMMKYLKAHLHDPKHLNS